MCSKEELEQAAEKGACKALARIGLDSPEAKDDVKELIGILRTFKMFKTTAIQTTARIFTIAFWAIVLGGAIAWLTSKINGGH